ncbi:MAG TPA: MarR family transcriptional regulator [Microlunatus sp.]
MPERPELGYLFNRLLMTVIDRELPIMERHGLDMWEYVIMSALRQGSAPTQVELSSITGRDKTRLIRNLDRLVEAGLVQRDADPEDRRNRVVSLTADGRRVLRACGKEIAEMERELLAALPAKDRPVFERALVTLDRDLQPHRQSRPRIGRSG